MLVEGVVVAGNLAEIETTNAGNGSFCVAGTNAGQQGQHANGFIEIRREDL